MTGPIPGFTDHVAEVNHQSIAYSRGGEGDPILLLHGFPQMRAMWRGIAPLLAERFTVIAADLRGYGDSSKPEGIASYAFREMALDQVALMKALGFERFHLVGHDRGARVAHRLVLDHESAVQTLTLMDIVPTHLLLDDLKREVARAYYHWFFLAQPSPFPEVMIGMDPDYYYEACLSRWDHGEIDDFDAEALDWYRQSWRWPDTIRSMCDDYRAAIEIDIHHDAIDIGRTATCPSLVMYGANGAMGRIYDVAETWKARLADMRALAMPGGHFFPDLHPRETAEALLAFLRVIE